MAQHSHVPKFGNWDTDDTPYTTSFENARKEKNGVRLMNPNDPEENPELFMYMKHALDNDKPIQDQEASNRRRFNPNNSNDTEEYYADGHMRQKIRAGNKVDKSSSDNSILQKPRHPRLKSDRRKKKSLGEGSNSSSVSMDSIIQAHPPRQRSGSSQDASSRKVASVPKFGSWDETDPKSGESFTVIFNKVKEEKQIASSTFPTVPAYTDNQKHNRSSSSRSKMCCCLF